MAMMHWMRWIAPYLLGAVLVAFLVSLAYFGGRGIGQDAGGREAVVTVNGESVPAVAYQRAYRIVVEQYRRAYRERFNEDLLKSLGIQEQVLDRLVVERLIAQRALAEGMGVHDAEVADQIVRMPAFQESGRFSRERYVRVLAQASPPLTPAEFEEGLRADLLRQKFQALVSDGAKVSLAEVRQAWELDRTKIRAIYARLSPAADGDLAVSDADLERYYKAHPAEFTQPERRRAQVAVLPSASVPAPAVTDAEIEVAYRARHAQFEQPTRAKVAHILVQVPTTGGSAAEDQAKAKAEAALQRVRGGADFAQVAREVSEDRQTAARGGEIGLLAQGELTPEIDRAVFGLKPGEVTGPVRSPFGYHVFKVLEIVPGSKKELREVAPTLRATLQAEGQLRALRDRVDADQPALVTASDFAAEARRRGYTVREIGPLAKTDAVEGVGRVQEATEAIFALPPGGVSAPVKVPEGYAIFRLIEAQPGHLPALAEIREDVTRAVRREKADDAARTRAAALVEAARRGDDFQAAARAAGATSGDLAPFSRAEPIADRALGQAIGPLTLGLPDGGVGGPVAGPGGFFVVKVLGREAPSAAEFESARAELEARLLRDKRARLWQEWLGSLRASANIAINRKILPEG
jgi:peptidyl-prolyl cis-trans isomerase D